MKTCQQHPKNQPCTRPAITVCWCPTWVNIKQPEAHKLAFGPRPNTTINRLPGHPIHLCATCAENFKPTTNPNAANGTFYWDEEANVEYGKAYAKYLNGENIV